MKISPTKQGNNAPQASQESSSTTPTTALPSDDVFNQLLQFLSQMSAQPDQLEASAVLAAGQSDMNKNAAGIDMVNNINELQPAITGNAVDPLNTVSQDNAINHINPLIKLRQVSDQEIKQENDMSALLDLLPAQQSQDDNTKLADMNLKDAISSADYVSDKLKDISIPVDDITARKAVDEKNINSLRADTLPQKMTVSDPILQAAVTDVLRQQGKRNTAETASFMDTTESESAYDQSMMDALDHSAISQLQSSSTSAELPNKINHSQSIHVQPLDKATSANDIGVSSLNLSTIPFDLSDKSKMDQSNKYLDAFINLGHFINSQTAELSNINYPAQPAAAQAQTQADPEARFTLAANGFDPAQDLKFEMSSVPTESHLSEMYDAKIKIYPPELGQVVAKLKVDKNNAELTILTENDHIKQIVESNLSVLKQHFQDADIHLTQIDVQTSQMWDKGSNNNQQNKEQVWTNEYENEPKQPKLTSKSSHQSDNAIVDTYA